MTAFAQITNGVLFKCEKGATEGVYKKIGPVYANCCTISHNAELYDGEGPQTLYMRDHDKVEEVLPDEPEEDLPNGFVELNNETEEEDD